MQVPQRLFSKLIKPLWFIGLSLPAVWLAAGLLRDSLGAEPVDVLINSSGEWSLRLLLLTLLISTLQRTLHWPQLGQLRRMTGLFTFFYAAAHLTIYAVLDYSLDIIAIVNDIIDRPFIAVGAATFSVLLALAITSPLKIRRKMKRLWKKLHNAIYLAVILAVIHFWWLVKSDITEPLLYAAVAALLLGERLWRFTLSKRTVTK